MEDFVGEFGADLYIKRTEREQEGFWHALSVPANEVPRCSSAHGGRGSGIVDHRGTPPDEEGNMPGHTRPFGWLKHAEWETSPAKCGETSVFTWLGGSQVLPFRAAHPPATARLSVDGLEALRFPLGTVQGFSISRGEFTLEFEPTRFQSLAENYDRRFVSRVSGFYRLTVPGTALAPGKPLRLRVDLDEPPAGAESFFFVSPRRDAMRVNLVTLRDELTQLRQDVMSLRASHEMLYAQQHPELFPHVIKSEKFLVDSSHRHLLVPHLTALRSGELVCAVREGTDHVSIDGKMVLYRSRDGGKTWGPQEPMFDLGSVDHRSTSILELPDGDWVGLDYRLGRAYNDGVYGRSATNFATCWATWSTDRGRTWSFSEEPVTPGPGAHPFVEAERHPILLPGGRILAAACMYDEPGGRETINENRDMRVGVFCSDDRGRHWRLLSRIPFHPWLYGESPMVRTRSGRILCMAHGPIHVGDDWPRTAGVLMQSTSTDDGQTWGPFESTGMSSMGSPGDLTLLQDGRVLCTHTSRSYPGSIYVTVSEDEGRTWRTDRTRTLTQTLPNWDSCYPSTAQAADGTLVTLWYSHLLGRFYVGGVRYRPEDL